KDQVFDRQGGGLSEYGLDKPKLALTLLGGDKENKPLAPTLYLGGRSPLGQLYYARLGDSKQVFTVIAPLKQELDLELYDLRDKSLVLFDGDKIDGLKLAVRDKGEVELKKKAAGRWNLVGPKPAQADSDLMEKLVYLSLKGQVTSFRPDNEAKEDHGFSAPLVTVKVLHQGREVAEVLLGPPEYKKSDRNDGSDKDVIGYWARTTERPEWVMLISRKMAGYLAVGYNDLKDRHVLNFSRGRLIALTVFRDKTLLKVKKVKDMWEVLEPASSVSQDRDIEKFLRALEELRYFKALDSETATLSRYGLDKPDLRVELTGPDKEAAVLAVSFNPTADGMLAVRAGNGPVLLVNQDDLTGALPQEVVPAGKPVSTKKDSEADRAASKKK
ncbi:MAG: DUF4340 domain-containing protein, partial [Pseudomonadota bacterium]